MDLVEYTKCKNDPQYFIETYIQLTPELFGVTLNIQQVDFLNLLVNDKFTIFIADGAIGKTVLFCGYMVHKMIFFPNKKHAAISVRMDYAAELIQIVYGMFTLIEDTWDVELTKKEAYTFELNQGSSLVVLNADVNLLKQEHYDTIIIDDHDLIKESIINDIMFYLSPRIQGGDDFKLILVATPT